MRPMRLLLTCLSVLLALLAPARAGAAEPPLEVQSELTAPLGPPALEPASTGGVELVDRALAKLATHRRLLVVGAHPDDEDTSALTLVSRGQGGESAYLSLSRGEGGQNLIGPELGVDLGLLRSRELLAAREVDGGRQFFTRAYDFGYTRSLDETFEKWPKEVLLEDAVRVIRRFRPQVIVSVFPGTPRAGHGQHQAAGVVAFDAFETAGKADAVEGDPERLGAPWSPSALYRATWWDRDATTLTTELGVADPLSGKTVFQIAMGSRSQHRSQDMGRILPLGSYRGHYQWVAGPAASEGPSEKPSEKRAADDLFDGIDTRLEAIALELLPEGPERKGAAEELAAARELAEEARRSLAPRRLGETTAALVRIRRHLRAAAELVGTVADRSAEEGDNPGADHAEALLAEKIRVADAALAGAAGVAVDAWTERSAIAPGETVRVEAVAYLTKRVTKRVTNKGAGEATGEGDGVRVAAVELVDPRAGDDGTARWRIEPKPVPEEDGWYDREGGVDGRELLADGPGDLAAGTLAAWNYEVTPRPDAEPSRPYYLPDPATSDGSRGHGAAFDPNESTLYDWPAVEDPTLPGEPFGPPPLVARFRLEVGGEELVVEREVVERTADQAVGEVRRPLRIVPAVEVSVEPELVVWSAASTSKGNRHAEEAPDALRVALRSHVDRPLSGRVRLETPDGWPAVDPDAFEIPRPHGSTVLEVPFRPPAGLDRGHYRLGVAAEVDGDDSLEERTYRAAYPLVDYPHIRPTPSPRPARVEVAAADIRLPELGRVGFLLGASDRVPRDLAAIGVPIETLTGQDLASLDPSELAPYDAIIVGSRAYETDADLGRLNGRLLDYARAGGHLVVLYQQYQFVRGEYAPYPLEINRPHDRVTDETAPVRLLEPDHPVFTTPNRIAAEDWDDWVQERGLYFAHTWDGRYRSLLQFPSDPALTSQGDAASTEGLRGGLLVAELGEGTYVYTGLAFFRQLPAGVTGAYRLFANLLALGSGSGGGAGSR